MVVLKASGVGAGWGCGRPRLNSAEFCSKLKVAKKKKIEEALEKERHDKILATFYSFTFFLLYKSLV